MKKTLCIISVLLYTIGVWAQSVDTLSIWDNNTAPTSNGVTAPMTDQGAYLENVTEAILTVYRPENPNGLAVIACPGGSYLQIWEKEFHNIARQWCTGITPYLSIGWTWMVQQK